ncbi:MAG: YbjQ family protein [Bacteroidetes bacterium]|nr:YbjQ family protein [Bacteroidota bacterium]
MILTTSPSIEGSSITSYIKPISSHVVLGTNIFSDIAASWRDVFGGRSQSYQNHLKRLTDAALNELEEEAKKHRADAVIAIDLDFSDITGGGKAGMLMVVATGTAVTLNSVVKSGSREHGRLLDSDLMDKELLKDRLIDSVSDNPDYALSVIEQLLNHRVHEVWELVWVPMLQNNYRTSLAEYLQVCAEEKGYRWILDLAINHESIDVRKMARNSLAQFDEFKLADLLPYASSQTEASRDSFLKTASLRQTYFRVSDAIDLRNLEISISDNFPIQVDEEVKVDKSGRETTILKCPCGGKLQILESHCDNCRKNAWGLPLSKSTPPKVIKALTAQRRVLERLGEER